MSVMERVRIVTVTLVVSWVVGLSSALVCYDCVSSSRTAGLVACDGLAEQRQTCHVSHGRRRILSTDAIRPVSLLTACLTAYIKLYCLLAVWLSRPNVVCRFNEVNLKAGPGYAKKHNWGRLC